MSDEEIASLAAFSGLSEHDFIQRFARLRHDRQGLVLEEKPNGECIFLEGSDCVVQAVKPQQCRDFPNRWSFPGFEKICQAKQIWIDAAPANDGGAEKASRMVVSTSEESRR